CTGIAIIATVLIGLFSYQVRHQQLQQLREETLADLLNTTLPVLRQLLSTNQPAQAFIDGLTQHPALASAVLLDEAGAVLHQSDRLQRQPCSNNVADALWYTDPGLSIYPLQSDDRPLGKLVLQPDRCYMLNTLHNTVVSQVSYAFILTLMMTGSLGFLIVLFMIRPLQALLRQATAIMPLP